MVSLDWSDSNLDYFFIKDVDFGKLTDYRTDFVAYFSCLSLSLSLSHSAFAMFNF